jgi:SAM-dependent methyltransferase
MAEEVGQFAGTARFYARFRPAYPTAVFDLLAAEAPLGPSSQALDLGCGTGLVGLALAGRVASVTGVDPDADMLNEAVRLAGEQGRSNLRWVQARAEVFEDRRSSYQLVVIGSAFHWMDRPLVADIAHRLLAPGGLFALLGNPTPLLQIRRGQGVGAAVAAVQDRWFPAEDFPRWTGSLTRPEGVIRASRFGAATVLHVPTRQEWDVTSLVGFLRSTSWRPDQVLGARFPIFEADLRDAVLAVEPTGRWIYEDSVEVILSHRS